MLPLPPVSLYVHLPWCVRKCPYCDFNSHAGEPDAGHQSKYLEALCRDFGADRPLLQGRPITSVFFGGGTPSLFSPDNIHRLLEFLDGFLAPAAEITLEANPGTAEAGRFRGYRSAGVNRLSVGVQSFQDRLLTRIGRIHDGQDARNALELTRTAGFDNFNVDLMYGLPGQSGSDLLRDVETALDYGPTHLSWYQLTIEPNTVFHRQRPALPETETLENAWERGASLLRTRGFSRYEVSAWSLADHRCRHNLNYWQFGDYLGIGAGAHGKITTATGVLRTRKPKQPTTYLAARFPAARIGSTVPREELPLEFLMNHLRLPEPVPDGRFQARTGLEESVLNRFRREAVQRGLLEPDRLQPTAAGLRFLDEMLALV